MTRHKPTAEAAPQKPAPDAMRLEQIEREATEWCGTGLLDDSDKRAVMSFARWLAKSAPVPPPDGAGETRLPCDVQLPGTVFRKGCSIEGLMVAIKRREQFSDNENTLTVWPATPSEVHAKLQEIVDLDSHGRYGRLAREAIGALSPEREYTDNTKAAAPDDVRSALEHAEVRFRCLTDHFKDVGEEALEVMSEVDAERMQKGLCSAPVSVPAHPFIEVPLTFLYKNHRDEVALRNVFPVSVRFGATEWHPEAQWLLRAFDRDKQAEREFAMRDINPPAAPPVRDREAIARIICCPSGCILTNAESGCVALLEKYDFLKTADAINSLPVQSSAAVGDGK